MNPQRTDDYVYSGGLRLFDLSVRIDESADLSASHAVVSPGALAQLDGGACVGQGKGAWPSNLVFKAGRAVVLKLINYT